MSSKLTTFSPKGGFELIDSKSLRLVFLISQFEDWILDHLVHGLHEQGFEGLTQSHLNFLGSLDCGVSTASGIAKQLRISRQAVHKTVKELENLNWLEIRQDVDKRNQRQIEFSMEGERMMAVARGILHELDDRLFGSVSDESFEGLVDLLQRPYVQEQG